MGRRYSIFDAMHPLHLPKPAALVCLFNYAAARRGFDLLDEFVFFVHTFAFHILQLALQECVGSSSAKVINPCPELDAPEEQCVC